MEALTGGSAPCGGEALLFHMDVLPRVVRLRIVRSLLRIPLFYKILIANAALIVLGAAVGTLLTIRLVGRPAGVSVLLLIAAFTALGIGVSLAVNAAILRVALSPLARLEHTAGRIQRGELEARAPESPVADRGLDRLTHTFNGMLDALGAARARLRDVARRALSAQEEERKRIARELHDETAQALGAVLVKLQVARRQPDRAARETMLEEVRQAIGEAMEGVRRFARGLRPPALDDLGLPAAVAAHARSLAAETGIRIEVRDAVRRQALAPEVELALYRIVQEALANAARHSGAATVEVRLEHNGAWVVATVQDDGRGFEPDQIEAAPGRGLGLFGMRERAAYVGGEVEITSAAGAGTRVRARVRPLGGTGRA